MTNLRLSTPRDKSALCASDLSDGVYINAEPCANTQAVLMQYMLYLGYGHNALDRACLLVVLMGVRLPSTSSDIAQEQSSR